ncbi:MAG: TolC family protein, partial [Prevotella sp.]
MKTRHIIIIIMGLLAGLGAHGQEAWTLDHCMAYAQEHTTEVRRQKLEHKQRRADYRASLLNFLPSVSAEATGQYSWGRNIDPETNTYNNVTTFNNYYQVGASVTLFDGGATWNAFRQARLDRTAAQSYVDKARDDVAMGVMAKYVDAVYTQRCIGLTEEKLRGSRALLVKTQRMFELGEKSRPDVVQVQSQVEEDEYNLLHQRNLAEKALADLKTAMNYPAADTLVVAGLPVDVAVASILPASRQACDSLMAHGFFLADKPAVVAAEAEAERARLAWKIQRASLMPKLTLSGGVATNYY